jgi:hypothetical protein
VSARPLPVPVNPALLRHADERRQHLENRWQTVQDEEHQNEQLLQRSNQILELTKAIHAMNSPRSSTGRNGTEQAMRGSVRNAMGR